MIIQLWRVNELIYIIAHLNQKHIVASPCKDLKALRPFCRPKFWSCVNLIISDRMITKNFSGSEKVRNWCFAPQPYSLLVLLLSNDGSTFQPTVNPIITSGLGPAAQYRVNALNRSYCSIIRDDHTLRICSQICLSKKKCIINICHYLTKSKFLTFSLPEKFLIIIFF